MQLKRSLLVVAAAYVLAVAAQDSTTDSITSISSSELSTVTGSVTSAVTSSAESGSVPIVIIPSSSTPSSSSTLESSTTSPSLTLESSTTSPSLTLESSTASPSSTLESLTASSTSPTISSTPSTFSTSTTSSESSSSATPSSSSSTSATTTSSSPSTVTVQPGDVLFQIAQSNGLSLAELEALNPQITNYDLIQPGQVINIKATTTSTSSSAVATQTGSGYSVTVRQGDTLNDIAAANGVSLAALEAANPDIENYNSIVPGQTITIPGANNAQGTSRTVTVAPGDTLNNIAAANGVTLAALEAANPNIQMVDSIYPGQVVRIPTGSSPRRTYTVQRGDTISALAARFGLTTQALENANPQISNYDLIQIGQVINVPGGGARKSKRVSGAKFRAVKQ